MMVIPLTALAYLALFTWAFRNLPRERWMMLAAIPRRRRPDGSWEGINLTFYGVFGALAVAWGLTVALFLMSAASLPRQPVLLGMALILGLCVPAASWINRWIEGHARGFTVGGASFLGMLSAPWLMMASLRLCLSGPDAVAATPAVLGALATAYACGESIGRLGCISFGCCYGRRLTDAPPWMQALFRRWPMVFTGPLKKVNRMDGGNGEARLPVQALTAVIFAGTGLAAMGWYLSGRVAGAYILAVAATQGWRFVSEFLRADTRKTNRITAYQSMALIGAVYSLLIGWFWPRIPIAEITIPAGFEGLANPVSFVAIAGAGLWAFRRMGVSTVTAARIEFVPVSQPGETAPIAGTTTP